MLLQPISELNLVSVLDRNIPNKECIAVSVNAPTNMGEYGLMLGFSNIYDGMAIPLRDNFFWFGDGMVKKGDWIFIYTGSGTPTTTFTANGQSSIFTLYWNRAQTLFFNSNIVPMLFRMNAVQVLPTTKALPQLQGR